ncbi:hypothetical protein GCM10027442_38100 [Emticicia fontis]
MEAVILNSIKIIASIIAGVAVGKIASKFIIQINAGTSAKPDLNKNL